MISVRAFQCFGKGVLLALASGFAGLSTSAEGKLVTTGPQAYVHLEHKHPPLQLVIGFMGGRVKATNFLHKEAALARDLSRRLPADVDVLVFANHDGTAALKSVLTLLDTNGNKTLNEEAKQSAHIVIYGHSWGASEAITLARSLDAMGIPVLLTIQVDSVQKFRQNDEEIPPNVKQAVNFYQAEGLLHGRRTIYAQDASKTRVLTNEEFHYRNVSVDTKGFPWFARTFMAAHIKIENDPRVWQRVEAMAQEAIEGRTVIP